MPPPVGLARVLSVSCLDHCASLPHLSMQHPLFISPPSIYMENHVALWSLKSPNMIWYSHHVPTPPHENLLVLHCCRTKLKMRTGGPLQSGTALAGFLTFRQVPKPVFRLPKPSRGPGKHCSASTMYLWLGSPPLGSLPQPLLCPEDWLSSSVPSKVCPHGNCML